jgi:UDPglucose--hexose-1-phosphate uridylyltransferase
MFKVSLRKPDGRELILYSRQPIEQTSEAPAPSLGTAPASPHLRWHPLRGEWVAYASHRQNRTFLPPPEYNPLAPTISRDMPTELPSGDYDVAVFENKFPTLSSATATGPLPELIVPTRTANGICEVVVFGQDPKRSLGEQSLAEVALVVDVWADRQNALGEREHIQYVMPFENRGVEVGVTLHHPHGQIYAYPFIPPVAARELAEQAEYLRVNGRGLLADHIQLEIRDGRRMLYEGEQAVAFVPACARYPYEAWVAPRRAAGSLYELTPPERLDFARALKTVLMKYDRLWEKPLPYLMVMHQAPTDGRPHPEAHLHAELYPPLRTHDRLKYLAGTELGAGMFANDALPEEKAEELRRIEVTLE